MRGKAGIAFAVLVVVGITPAYAGKSQFGRSIQFQSKDHPRLCGEKQRDTPSQPRISGSPPPMRGKVFTVSTPCVSTRITPAYAGKSSRIPRLHLRERDHPRLCGEKGARLFAKIDPSGSPPPMRGKVFKFFRRGFSIWDHPRLCGEKGGRSRGCAVDVGSPPPMRGKGRSAGRHYRHVRITPAYAGKRSVRRCFHYNSRDHPRLCGEKAPVRVVVIKSRGSPPPMRGKDEFHIKNDDKLRITPAYAGKSQNRKIAT